MHLALMIFGVC